MTGLNYWNTTKKQRKWLRKRWRKVYRKRRYGTGRTKIINSSSRSKCTIKARISSGYSVPIPAHQNYTPVICVSPWWYRTNTNTGDDAVIVNQILPWSTCGTDLYRSFCTMYDSVKVDAVYARITIQNIVGAGGPIAALNVYTAWDRQMNLDDLKADVYPTFNKMRVLPSCTCSIVSNNTGSTIYRYCKASSFMEKYCYLDSTQRDFTFALYGYNSNLRGDEALKNGGGNWPGFCPALYICFETPHMTPTETFTVYYVVDYVVLYTFKNPYGSGAPVNVSKEKERTVTVGVSSGMRFKEAIAEGSPTQEIPVSVLEKRARLDNETIAMVDRMIDGDPDASRVTLAPATAAAADAKANDPYAPSNMTDGDDIVLSSLTKLS